MRPVTAPTVIAEGRLMVEIRAEATGVRLYVGEEADDYEPRLASWAGVIPPDITDAISDALRSAANVARALSVAMDQAELPGIGGMNGDQT